MPIKCLLIFSVALTLSGVMADQTYDMQKKKECNVRKREGSSDVVKIGKNQEKPMQTCKSKCLKKEAVACGYNEQSRECTIVYSGGLKGIEDATGQNKGKSYCGELVDVDTEGESEEEVEGVTEKKCTLKAKLGFPYDDPDGAEFYGYHADMLDVTEAGDDWFVCSWYYTDGLPDWCTYENSDPNGDSAYVVNFDDEWKDWEELTEETIKVFNAAGRSFVFKVEHYYFAENYYENYDNFEDHMNAATLWIDVTTGKNKGSLKKKGWQHPTSIDISTHIQKTNGNWKVNPDYEGIFTVTVDCNKNCKCTATYELP